MRSDPRRVLGPLALSLCLTLAASAQAGVHPDLRRQMDEALPGDQLRAYLVMRDQLGLRELMEEFGALSARERRVAVAARLRQHAARSQASVRGLLDPALAEGRAQLIDVLWMGNALLFSAEPSVIEALAGAPGVDRVRPIRDDPPASYEDGSAVASYPFTEDFESCTLEPYWKILTGGAGYVAIDSDHEPSGSCQMVMASSVDGTESTASATLLLDLEGETDVGIKFGFKEFSDESDPEDGVFISVDGVDFHLLTKLEGSATYETLAIDLDAAVEALGLSYSATTYLRFSWGDNFDLTTDGFAFDDIKIGPGLGQPPPPGVEANIVQLQAPQLWEMGFDGAGVLIGNIDSGVDWSHPDLAQRIWQNPGEIPGNGVDDDGNGKVDDIVGWDFAGNDNNPVSLATHGTCTAGLMVGDGTSGKSTGMAPGGTLVACLVSGEANYWQAQQYCMTIGVDVVSSSHSFKWPFDPDYHMHRQMCAMELAAGIVHANSIGNQGGSTTSFPIPFNVSTPGNCPQPFGHPAATSGGRSSVLGCAGIHVEDDSLYTPSGERPSAWEDLSLYDPNYLFSQDPTFWDYPVGGFGGGQPGLLKPDIVTYTDPVTTTTNGGGYTSFGGTSAATPQLGGGLMLLRQVQPHALPRHLGAAVELSAVDLGEPGKDTRFGAGKLQVFDAARRLALLGSAEDPTPAPGQLLTLKIHGEADALGLVFLGADIDVVPSGLELQPPTLVLSVFQLDPAGEGAFSLVVPADPGLSGATVYFQLGALAVAGSPWGTAPLISVPELVAID